MSVYMGIGFPFTKGDDGIPAAVFDADVIRDSIRQILLTGKGERVMRPDVGARIHTLVFENNDPLLADIAKAEVRGIIGRYETRAIVRSVSVRQFEDLNGEHAEITVEYVIPALRTSGTLDVTISKE